MDYSPKNRRLMDWKHTARKTDRHGSNMPLVQVENVRRDYKLGEATVHALKGIDLEVEKGDFMAVSGPSGAGKSTLMNLIGCIDVPSEGKIFIGGDNVAKLNEKERTRYRRNTMGFIFQAFNLIPVLDVYENIELPLLLKRDLTKEERRNRVMSFVEEVGLEDRVRNKATGNKATELSGGQRQRVAIARALVTDPLIVLADEPTGNLDSETGQMILSLMHRINERHDTTFIFSTHDEQILSNARRIVRIRDGAIEGEEHREVER
jgi:putative ABC transport system ATP-binding protein